MHCLSVWDTFVSNSRYGPVRTTSSMYFSQTLVLVHTGTYRYRDVPVNMILPDPVQGERVPDADISIHMTI